MEHYSLFLTELLMGKRAWINLKSREKNKLYPNCSSCMIPLTQAQGQMTSQCHESNSACSQQRRLWRLGYKTTFWGGTVFLSWLIFTLICFQWIAHLKAACENKSKRHFVGLNTYIEKNANQDLLK
jgi:hypothetical protein